MEPSVRDRNKCLLQWIQSLPPFSEERLVPTNEHFKDGMMTSRILKRTIDPAYFADLKDGPKEFTELVNVVKKMKEYISVHQPVGSHIVPKHGKIVASGDIQEINRLMQFILGCAIHSQRKNELLEPIRSMDKPVQVDLMEVIQELLPHPQADDKSDLPEIDLSGINVNSEILKLNDAVEQLSQENHNLTVKLSEIREEKLALIVENERLNAKFTEQMNDPESIHVSIRVQEELKKEAEGLREENYRLETTVDDLRLKIQVLDKQVTESQNKVALCTTLQEDLMRHKDEMDSLREAAAKVKQQETVIQQYKNKLEGMEFLKRSMKELEEKNEELNKTNMHLEDEVKKVNSYKSQADDLKKKLIENQQSLTQENHNTRRLEFESRQQRDKIESLTAANDTLREEKRSMAQLLEETKLGSSAGDGAALHADSVDSIELLTPSVRQRITRLELENKELKKKINSGVLITSDEGSKVLVEELRKREAELDEELLAKNQEFIDLQAACEDKVRRLEAQVLAKEEELKKKDLQYKRHMEKAKSVIETLEPTQAAGTPDSSKADRELEKARVLREVEEKLMASAFYSYGLSLHRNAVETKNTTLLQKHRNNAASRRKSEL